MPCPPIAREVIRSAPAGENARVDGGMERFYTSIHHLGETGHVGHVHDGEPGGGQRFCRATGRHELDPQSRVSPRPSSTSPDFSETLNNARIPLILLTFRSQTV